MRSARRRPLRALPTFFCCFCAFYVPPLVAGDWPGWRGPRRDGVWRESGIVSTLPDVLKYRWRQPIGSGYAGPAVAGGRVFVTDRVLAADAENPGDPFSKEEVRGLERIHCFDSRSGKPQWKREYPADYAVSYPYGPRATPTVDGNRVYTLGTMGDLHCLKCVDGSVVWSRNLKTDFSARLNTWGYSAAPLIDGERIILLVGGADGAGVVALDKMTGKELWRALQVRDPGYCPPVIYEMGGTRQLVIWTPAVLASLDPETGKLYWSEPFKVQSGLSIATPIYDPQHRLLFISAFYNGPLMMKVMESGRGKPRAEVIWRGSSDSEIRTDKLHSLMSTPFFQGNHIYGICSYGQFRCLESRTGKRVWETLEATGKGRWWNAFVVQHADGADRERRRLFIHNEQGDLIIAKVSPEGYEELSRAPLIKPTRKVHRRMTVWSHPAFAERAVFARNDNEIVCAELAASAYAGKSGD